MRRVWIDPWSENVRIREFSQLTDNEMQYKVDFSSSATDRGTSVSSATWTSIGSPELTVGNKALSSDVATADVSSAGEGPGLLEVEATYADGNTEKVQIRIWVKSLD